MCKHKPTKWIVIFALVAGGWLIWKTMPEHKRIFWRNMISQAPDLPARYIV